jgi:hypothetical protein
MAWLFHPDDFAALQSSLPNAAALAELDFGALVGAIDIRADPTVDRGKIKDDRCPLAGALSPRAFSLLQRLLQQEDDRKFKKAVAMFEKLTAGGIASPPADPVDCPPTR